MQDPQRDSSPAVITRLSPAMRQFELWTVLLYLLSITFHAIARVVFHRHDFFANPIDFHPEGFFADFRVFTGKYAFFHTDRFFPTGLPMVYPAPVGALFGFFFQLPSPYSLYAMLTFSAAAFAIPALLFGRYLHRLGIPASAVTRFILVLLVLSWPIILILHGANSEVFVWVALAMAIWLYSTGRLWGASVWFGLAASLKLFPFVFFALFLKRNQLPKLALAILCFAGSFFFALWFEGPTIHTAFRGFVGGMNFAEVAYFTPWRGLEHGVDHSLFGLVKFILIMLHASFATHFHRLLKPYEAVTALAGLILYATRIRNLPVVNQILAFSVVSIYLTAFSGDGTLVHLYYPLALLFIFSLEADRKGWVVPGLARMFGCLVFCLSFETFLVVPLAPLGLRFEGPAHAVALGLLLYLSLRYPIAPPPEAPPAPELLPPTYAVLAS